MASQSNKNERHEHTSGQIPQGYFIPIPSTVPENEVIFRDLIRVVLDYKRIIAAVVIICAIISVIVALVITPVYRADVLLAPAGSDNNNRGGIAAFASQFGGLANLAGISVGSGGDIETAIATLKSRKFITRFVTDYGLKPILFESQWVKEKKQWVADEPTDEKTYKKFSKDILKVSQDKKTQLIRVSVEWENPQQAAEWANTLVKRLNEELRQQTIFEAERSIAYLTEQISQTSLSELQNVLYRIIEEHTKIITLAKVNDEYVMKVIDPAVPPETKYKPNRKLIVILSSLLGVILGVIIALTLNAARNWRIQEIQK